MPLKIFCLEDEIHIGGYEQRQRLKPILEGHDVTYALSVDEAKAKFNPPYHLLILDHDLGGIYETNDLHPNVGMRFIEWMVEQKLAKPYPQVILHSVNHRNRLRMRKFLEDHGYHVQDMPFNDKYLSFMQQSFGLKGTT